jgi:hyperosmotically inducible periplasmic protein
MRSAFDSLSDRKLRRNIMKILFPLLIGGALLVGTVGCDNVAKTSANAPNAMDETTQAPDAQTAQQNQADGTDETRKRQLESDIRAREQRNDTTGGDMERADGDLKSEVRSKLEANLPASQLAVDAKDGVVTVTGTVATQEQLQKVDVLAMEIKGVSSVSNKAKVAPAQAN